MDAETAETNGAGSEGLLDEWIGRHDLARELDVSADTLARWETRRTGPPCIRIGRRILYRRETVRDWLRQRESARPGARR